MLSGIKSIEDLFLLMFFIVLIVTAIALFYVIAQIKDSTDKIIAEKKGLPYKELTFETWWKRFIGTEVDVSDEETILLTHEYDGIKELDNHLPPWWTGLFWLTIIFSVVYMLVYHVWKTAPLQEEEYNIAVAKADKEIKAYIELQGGSIDENTVVLDLENQTALTNGKEIYDLNCMACHGMQGEGTVGPNLTDEYWIHGGSINDIFSVIKYGVPEKGMISWQTLLKPNEIQDVSNYIVTLIGTNPDNPKDPEGEKYDGPLQKESVED